MKRFLIVILVIVLSFALLITGAMIALNWGLIRTKSAAVGSIDPSGMNDGTYTGRYATGRWANEIAVTIEDCRITSIEVIEDVRFADASDTHVIDAIVERVLEKQDCDVDTVTGATVTSKAYLKAIEDALAGE